MSVLLTRSGIGNVLAARVEQKSETQRSRLTDIKRFSRKLALLGGIIIACVIAVFLWQARYRTESSGSGGLHSIAVLPLQNLNGDVRTDYLRFALADEIVSCGLSSGFAARARRHSLQPRGASSETIPATLTAYRMC
jgi:hypothetical protein